MFHEMGTKNRSMLALKSIREKKFPNPGQAHRLLTFEINDSDVQIKHLEVPPEPYGPAAS